MVDSAKICPDDEYHQANSERRQRYLEIAHASANEIHTPIRNMQLYQPASRTEVVELNVNNRLTTSDMGAVRPSHNPCQKLNY